MKSLILALQFLTRIPIKLEKMEVNDQDFGLSQRAFIIVALIMGSFSTGLYLLLTNRLPDLVLGFILLAFEIIISGGLLLDGFMDTCDGIFSSRPREEAMEIMRDSRVGAYSVTFVILLFLSKFAVYSSLTFLKTPYLITFFAPAAGMWFLLFIINYFPYARQSGVGKYFKDQASFKVFFINTLLIVALFALSSGLQYLIMALLGTFFISFLIAAKINSFLEGQTGDTYGAMAQTSQAIFMLIMTFLLF